MSMESRRPRGPMTVGSVVPEVRQKICHHSWEPDMIGGESGTFYYTCSRCGVRGEQPSTGGLIKEARCHP